MAILPEELESDQTKLSATASRLAKQQELLVAYENGHIEVGNMRFDYPAALTSGMKVKFAELRNEIVELENAITG